MAGYGKYLLERLVIFLATIFISVTVVFFVPRLVPGEPLGAVMNNLASMGGSFNAKDMIEEYRRLFGLDKVFGSNMLVIYGHF